MNSLDNRTTKGREKFDESISKLDSFHKFHEPFISVHRKVEEIFAAVERFEVLNSFPTDLFDSINSIQKALEPHNKVREFIKKQEEVIERIENSAEVQFAAIADLEIFSLSGTTQFISSLDDENGILETELEKNENTVERNLVSYLKKLKVDSMWKGANFAMNCSASENPDKLRHCFVSLRTLLEYMIEVRLAPNEILCKEPTFKKQFKLYHSGGKTLGSIKVKRMDRIRYFSSKIKFGLLEKLTEKDINFIRDFYVKLCEVHKSEISLTEKQARILKYKTGITLWLLAIIDEVLNDTSE